MGFLDSLKSIFSGDGELSDAGYWIYVRSRRCKELIKTRVDLRNDLSLQDEGGYLTRKVLIGNNSRCFERVEVTLIFDQNRQLIDHQASGGELISAEAYEAALKAEQQREQEEAEQEAE